MLIDLAVARTTVYAREAIAIEPLPRNQRVRRGGQDDAGERPREHLVVVGERRERHRQSIGEIVVELRRVEAVAHEYAAVGTRSSD